MQESPPHLLHFSHWPSICLFIALGAVTLLTFHNYGIAADGPAQRAYGELLLRYYASFGADDEILYRWNWCLYGGLFELICAIAERVSPFGGYETRHLVCAVSGILAIGGCWKVAALLAGSRAGFFSALLLALTPSFYGQMFINTKDVPFAAGYVWSIYFLMRCVPTLPDIPLKLIALTGVAIGMTLGIRIGGFVLLCYLAAIIAGRAIVSLHLKHSIPLQLRAIRRMTMTWLAIAIVSYAIMVFFWPYAQRNPLTGPFHALDYFTHFVIPISFLYGGNIVIATDLPLDYVPVMLAISLPEFILILVLAGGVLGIARLTRKGNPPSDLAQYGLLILSIIFPIAYVIAQRSALYNGIRHILFVLPPMAAAAGLTLVSLLDRLRLVRRKIWTRTMVAVMTIYGAWHLSQIVRLHPYEYAYLNSLAGGTKRAAAQYEFEYQTCSLSEAARKLASHLASDPRRYRVFVCPSPGSASYYFPARIALAKSIADADFYLGAAHTYCRKEMDGETLFKVERAGVVLAIVKDRRNIRKNTLPSTKPRPG